MYNVELIFKYFPNLSSKQKEQFTMLEELYRDWNSKINVISRKDMDSFWVHHVLHSLAIAKIISFKPNTKIMDVGTGGGFPGIPLAIMFPECQFLLVDSIGKKIKVVEEVSKSLGLTNVRGQHTRVENIKEQFDFITSRGVTAFPDFVKLVKGKIFTKSKNELKNGILYLKGGDFTKELTLISNQHQLFSIPDFFAEDFFETKKIIHLRTT